MCKLRRALIVSRDGKGGREETSWSMKVSRDNRLCRAPIRRSIMIGLCDSWWRWEWLQYCGQSQTADMCIELSVYQ